MQGNTWWKEKIEKMEHSKAERWAHCIRKAVPVGVKGKLIS